MSICITKKTWAIIGFLSSCGLLFVSGFMLLLSAYIVGMAAWIQWTWAIFLGIFAWTFFSFMLLAAAEQWELTLTYLFKPEERKA